MPSAPDRLRLDAWLPHLSLACIALLTVQSAVPGHTGLGFLAWNLLLAWTPWLLAALASRLRRAGGHARIPLAACAVVWLVFFPNAPYIVTDLVHLRPNGAVLFADAATILAFALCGLLLAFASLRRLHALAAERLGPAAGWALVGVVSLLTGFGVYLGRVRRWNSWDLLARPEELLGHVATRAADPLAHPSALVVTIGFGAAFLVWYVCVWSLTARREPAMRPRQRRPA